MPSSIGGKLFNAEITKGYIIRVIVDTLCSAGINRGIFVIDRSGIVLRQNDKDKTILYDIELPSVNLSDFKCSKNMAISVNLKHMQGLLKTIKKKDCISLHVLAKNQGKLFITIQPDGSREIARFEIKSIAYQVEQNYVLSGLPDGGYQYPMMITSTDFQKVKQLTAISKQITVRMQNNNYLSFECDAGPVMDSKLVFGTEITADVGVCGQCEFPILDCECGLCVDCDLTHYECQCECEMCGELYDNCACGVEAPHNFLAAYPSSILNKLVKLPGLCSQMQFYAPYVAKYPLRIEANASLSGYILGKIKIYIKDVDQINYEASLQKESDTIVQITKTKGKGKKKSYNS